MLKDITLGQFFPGTTVIHKLDPRTKLVWVILYIVALFLAKWFVSYALVLVTLAAVIAALLGASAGRSAAPAALPGGTLPFLRTAAPEGEVEDPRLPFAPPLP